MEIYYIMQIGDKYGRYTIVGKTDDYRKVVCECECGTIRTVRKDALKRGDSKSCGCLKRDLMRLDDSSASALNALYTTQYRRRANERGYTFELTLDQFRQLTKQKCYYCGIEPYKVFKNGKSEYTYNGIDRLDNTLGYVYENCRTACFTCNQAKHTMTTEEFTNWINRLMAYQRSINITFPLSLV